jgi:hypothetical protein
MLHNSAVQSSPALVRRALRRTGSVALRLCGDSMRPSLPHHSRVRLRPVREGEPRVGDLVAVAAGARVVVHRVVAVSAGGVRTQGDHVLRRDPLRSRRAVIGIVDAVQTAPGRWRAAPAGARLGRLLRAWCLFTAVGVRLWRASRRGR